MVVVKKKPLAGFFYFTFFHAEAGTLSHNVLCVISAPRWSEALIIASSSLPDSLSRKLSNIFSRVSKNVAPLRGEHGSAAASTVFKLQSHLNAASDSPTGREVGHAPSPR